MFLSHLFLLLWSFSLFSFSFLLLNLFTCTFNYYYYYYFLIPSLLSLSRAFPCLLPPNFIFTFTCFLHCFSLLSLFAFIADTIISKTRGNLMLKGDRVVRMDFFKLLFGHPMANFGPFSREQPHQPDVNHYVLTISIQRSPGAS